MISKRHICRIALSEPAILGFKLEMGKKAMELSERLSSPMARAPVGRDAAWLPGFMMAVVRAPKLPIDLSAWLSGILDNSN